MTSFSTGQSRKPINCNMLEILSLVLKLMKDSIKPKSDFLWRQY